MRQDILLVNKSYLERNRTHNEIIRRIRPGRASENVNVWGYRRTGRTAVLQYIYDSVDTIFEKSDWQVVPIFIDFEMFSGDIAQVYSDVCNAISNSHKLPNVETQVLGDGSFDELNSMLEKCFNFKVWVIFLLDNFDEVLRRWDIPVDNQFKGLQNYASFIYTTLESVHKTHPEYNRPGPSRFIGSRTWPLLLMMTEYEASTFVQSILSEEGFSASHDEVEMLIEVAGKHPELLQLACGYYQTIRNNVAHDSSNELDYFDTTRLQLIEYLLNDPSVNDLFTLYWYSLPNNLQEIVIHMIKDNSFEESLREELRQHPLIGAGGRNIGTIFQAHVEAMVSNGESDTFEDKVEDELSGLDLQMFRFLRSNSGNLSTYNAIKEEVWSSEETPQRAIDASLYRIRTAIESIDSSVNSKEYIRTTRGVGLQLNPR